MLEQLVDGAFPRGKVVPGNWHIPAMGVVNSSFPSWDCYENLKRGKKDDIGFVVRNDWQFEDDRALNHFPCSTFWPVSIDLIQNLQQAEYWNVVVPAYGREAFHTHKIIGQLYYREKARNKLIKEPDYERGIKGAENRLPLGKTRILSLVSDQDI